MKKQQPVKIVNVRMQKSNLGVDNRLTLIGFVANEVKRYTSPSGIAHCQFWFNHRSKRIEAGFEREVSCKIPVQVSGNILVNQTHSITVGSKLMIIGFLYTRTQRNGLSQLTLHAEQIEFID